MRYARDILANNARNFDLIFSLLGVGGPISQKAWALLDSLPKNEAVRKRIITLGGSANAQNTVSAPSTAPPAPPSGPVNIPITGIPTAGGDAKAVSANAAAEKRVDWSSVLESKSVLKLLYSMQIVHSLLNKDKVSTSFVVGSVWMCCPNVFRSVAVVLCAYLLLKCVGGWLRLL